MDRWFFLQEFVCNVCWNFPCKFPKKPSESASDKFSFLNQGDFNFGLVYPYYSAYYTTDEFTCSFSSYASEAFGNFFDNFATGLCPQVIGSCIYDLLCTTLNYDLNEFAFANQLMVLIVELF